MGSVVDWEMAIIASSDVVMRKGVMEFKLESRSVSKNSSSMIAWTGSQQGLSGVSAYRIWLVRQYGTTLLAEYFRYTEEPHYMP
jgi:hypothetical protein